MRTALDTAITLLFLLELILVAEVLLDLIAAGADSAETAPGVERARVGVHRVTDPILVPLRRVWRPVHVGGARPSTSRSPRFCSA